MVNSKIGLSFGIIILFVLSAVAPITTGIYSETSEVNVEDYNFNRHLYPEYYDSYSVDEIPENIRACISNNDEAIQDVSISEVINNEETPKPLDGPMDSAWPMYCHDTRHTGRSPYITVDNPYFENWRCRLSEVSYHCAPVIDSEGIIYVGRGDLYAFYPNGSLKWKYDYPHHVESAPAIDENGIIYIGTVWAYPNYLYAIYSSNGTLKWKYKTSDVYSSPAIGDDGTIYFGDTENWRIKALYPNGTLKWSYKTNHVIYSSPAIGLDGTIFCGSHDGNLYALYPNNGTVKWKHNTGSWVHGSPTIADDGTVYIGSDNGKLYAFYPNNGTVKWSRSAGYIWGSPAIDADGTIYVGNWNMKFFAIYPNGTIKWKYDAPGRIWFGASAAISADGIIYFGTTWMDGGEGAFIALNSDGTERFKITKSGLFETSPAIGSDGTIYACSSDDEGLLHAFGYPGPNPLPPTINGPSSGKPGIPYIYSFTSIDPDDDHVSYYIEWGDGTSTGWTGFQPSGETITKIHTWATEGTYILRAKAKDTDGYESDWGTLDVSMPRDKATNNVFLRFVERFPLLQKLLLRIK